METSIIIPREKEEAIKGSLAMLQAKLETLVINDEQGLIDASAYLSVVKANVKRIKFLRDELIAPIKAGIRQSENWFKSQLDPFEYLEVKAKDKIANYSERKEAEARKEAEKAERVRLEAEEKQRKADEEAQRKEDEAKRLAEAATNDKEREEADRAQKIADDAKAKAEAIAPVAPAEAVERPRVSVQTEHGKVFTSRVWTFEVTDIALVPKDLIEVNGTEVLKRIRLGVREIDGIRVFEKTIVTAKS